MTFPNLPGRDIVPRGYRCAVCTAGAEIAAFVDRLIVSGSTYAEAHRALGPINEAREAEGHAPISYQSVLRHGRDHLPARSAAVREIVERRARAAQLDVDGGATNLVTVAGYAEVLIVKAYQNIVDGNTEVAPELGLAAAKFLNQLMMAERGNVGVETAFAELGYLIESVKEIVPQQYWPLITAKIDEKRGDRGVIDAHVEEFDPGEQPEEDFNPADDGDEDF